jgi:hypothetical protein
VWGEELRDHLVERTRGVRAKTADQIQLVQQATERITSALQSGQDAIRSSEDNSRIRPIAS